MRWRKELLVFVLSGGVLFLLWALLTSGFKLQESLLGIFAALVAALLFMLTRIKTGSFFHPSLRELLSIWRVPWYILAESWLVVRILAEDLLGIRKAGSYFRAVPFDAGTEGDVRTLSRIALATTYSTMAPNSIVVGVDRKQGQMLIHQLQRTPVSEMTRQLGAKG